MALSLLGGFAGIYLFGPSLLRQGCAAFRWFLASTSTDPSGWTAERLPELARLCATALFWGVLPTAVLCSGMSIASSILQGGFQIRAEAMQPSLARLDPLEGARRLLGLRSMGRGLFAAAKFVLVGLLGAALLARSWEVFLPAAPGIGTWEACLEKLAGDGLKISLGLSALAVLDYLFQFWQHERDLRMTRAELKEEISRLEGNLEVKGRQRKARRRLLGRRSFPEVRGADVLAVLGTYMAVAIRVEGGPEQAPEAVAHAEGSSARSLIDAARSSGVPIVEDRDLVLELWKGVSQFPRIPDSLKAGVAALAGKCRRTARRGEEGDLP